MIKTESVHENIAIDMKIHILVVWKDFVLKLALECTICDKIDRKAGAELCQAQFKLG